jgi:hypothetical protein
LASTTASPSNPAGSPSASPTKLPTSSPCYDVADTCHSCPNTSINS